LEARRNGIRLRETLLAEEKNNKKKKALLLNDKRTGRLPQRKSLMFFSRHFQKIYFVLKAQ